MITEKEKPIIWGLIEDLSKNNYKENSYKLFFKDGTEIIAKFINCGDSDNGLDDNDPNYEDVYGFDFEIKRIVKRGNSLKFKKNDGICLNYHNFPIKWELYNK